MKKIIGYAVARNAQYFRTTPFNILAVTTIKGRQVYGRSIVDDAATHIAERDMLLMLDTLDDAKLFLERAGAIDAKHARKISDLHRDLRNAERAKQDELDQLARETAARK